MSAKIAAVMFPGSRTTLECNNNVTHIILASYENQECIGVSTNQAESTSATSCSSLDS